MLRPAVIGQDGRTSALISALSKSRLVGGAPVPAISTGRRADHGNSTEALISDIVRKAREVRPDFIVVGPEEPLEAGVVDALQEIGVPCVGPTKQLARLESSKSWTRELLRKHGVPGNPTFRIFDAPAGLEEFIRSLESGFVIKPDGLTGGKGVKVSGDHLDGVPEGVAYAVELLEGGKRVVVEEKLDGEEFSLMAFCDGITVKEMVVVQDHKRAYVGDTGPNTGGMGSYSCENHQLPFLTDGDLAAATQINKRVAAALLAETGQPYKGILYGGFMATRDGVRLLEYNARFGDPETMNVLPLLLSDLVEICQAIIYGRLDEVDVAFANKATVCKYVVPKGYPDNPLRGAPIDLGGLRESEELRIYPAAVEVAPDGSMRMTGSRALAIVGIGDTLEAAEAVAERTATACEEHNGNVFHRRDIGTRPLIDKRVNHMRSLRMHGSSASAPEPMAAS